jgi:ADP-ribose pyrophosphatase YjhB (NUDIX family)
VGISAHVAKLRAAIGHDLIVLPSASVLPVDEAGRLLLVSPAGHDDGWHILGGAIDPGESPAEAAVRESREEIGTDVRLRKLLGVFGGPDFEVTYPNGDMVAYVTAAYEAEITGGDPVPDGDELTDAAWFSRAELGRTRLSRFARSLLRGTGYLE